MGHLLVEAVELLELLGVQRRLGAISDLARNPVVHPSVLHHLSRRCGGGDLLAADYKIVVLVRHRLQQRPGELVVLLLEPPSLFGKLLDLPIELALARGRDVVDDAGDRLFQLAAALFVAVKDAHTERLKGLGDLFPDDPQGLGGMAGNENALLLGEQVPDEVGDRVALARPRRSLDEDRARLFKPANDHLLLRVGVLRQQEIRCHGLVVRPIRLAAGLDSDHAEQRLRELGGGAERLHVAIECVGESLVAAAQVEQWLTVEDGAGSAVERRLVVEVLAIGPQPLHEGLEEVARRVVAKGMGVLPCSEGLQLVNVLAFDAEVAEQRGIEVGIVLGFSKGELRYAWIEGQLNPLQHNGVSNGAVGPVQGENPVPQVELVLFRLPGEAAPQLKEIGEDGQGVDDVLFGTGPLPPQALPLFQRLHSLRRIFKGLFARACAELSLGEHARLACGVVPTRLEPLLDDDRGRWALRLLGAADLEYEVAVADLAGPPQELEVVEEPAPLNGPIVRQRVELQTPRVLLKVDGG